MNFYWIIYILVGYLLYRYTFVNGRKANINVDLSGKVIIITGSSDGIGKETAKTLASKGAHIVFACRSENKTKEVMNEIQKETGNSKLTFIHLDLSDLNSIVKFVEEFRQTKLPMDHLINNAGILEMAPGISTSKTKQNYEIMFGVNYLGHFLLNRLLIPEMIKYKTNVVIVSSITYKFVDFIDWENRCKYPSNLTGIFEKLKHYSFTKLLGILHTRKLHQMLKKEGVKVNCLHPGSIATTISKQDHFIQIFISAFTNLFLKTPIQGSQTTLHCIAKNDNLSGEYYDNCQRTDLTGPYAKDDELGDKLWRWTESELQKHLTDYELYLN